MARWKLGPNGGYLDQNDTGPDQYTPTPAEAAAANPGTGTSVGEGPGGISGRAQNPNFRPMPTNPNAMTDQGGYARPYYPPGGMTLTPGQGGWSMNGGPQGGFASILQALQRMYGGQPGGLQMQSTAGDFIPTAQRQQSPAFAGVPPAPATTQPSSGGGGGRFLGGALGGLI